MKQFLYMDIDIVNSIIAQAEKGLTTNKQQEDTKSNDQGMNIATNMEAEGKAGASILKILSGEAGLKSGINLNGDFSESTVIRNINEKKIHDEAFDIACQYIKIDTDTEICDDYGEYIKLDRLFSFVDLDYLEKVFSKDGIIDMVIESEQDKAENEFTKNMNRDQKRASNKEITELRKNVKKENEDVAKIITKFRNIMPYTKMLISDDGYLVPLDEKYFRVNPSSMGFMYDGQIACIGMITNIIGDDIEAPSTDNIFGTIQYSVNNVIRALLPTKEKNLCVIHPIAVFYEN